MYMYVFKLDFALFGLVYMFSKQELVIFVHARLFHAYQLSI